MFSTSALFWSRKEIYSCLIYLFIAYCQSERGGRGWAWQCKAHRRHLEARLFVTHIYDTAEELCGWALQR